MAEIALNILQGNKNTLDATGAKEIIALYLMIPYMTKSRLDAPRQNRRIRPNRQSAYT